MKKSLLFLAFTVTSLFVLASTVPVPGKAPVKQFNAKLIQIPIGASGKKISLYDLSKISRADLEALTGKKMSLWERFAFKKTKQRLAKGMDADGNITDKKLNKGLRWQDDDHTRGFHFVGFVLGFVLGIVGVVIAYVLDENPDKKNRVKWAWIGFAIAAFLLLAFYAILLAAIFTL